MSILKIKTNNKNYNRVRRALKYLDIKPDYINSGLGLNPNTNRMNKTYTFVVKKQENINLLLTQFFFKSCKNWISESGKEYTILYTKEVW